MATPILPTQPHSIPPDLRIDLPDPWIPWGISKRTFNLMKEQDTPHGYKKVELLPTDPEWRFIWRYFHHDKPTKYTIKRIYTVHEKHQMQAFEFSLSSIEREASKFPPNWNKEPRATQRAAVIDRWKQATQIFSPFQTMEKDGKRRTWNNTKVLPLWHGTSEDICDSICSFGFVYFGKTNLGTTNTGDPQNTDDGFFGSGIYFTNSARYAADIYSRGHILLAWVSMREPFPVVGDPSQLDMQTLKAKGAYKNYNAHYVPVTPEDPNPDCAMYYPTQPGCEPTCDEIVVFQKAQALPRFVIELEVSFPYLLNPSDIPLFVEEFIPHLFKMLEHKKVDRDTKLRNVLNSELAVLLTLKSDDDLEEKHQTLFSQMAQLIDQTGNINKIIRKQITGSSQTTPLPNITQMTLTRPPTSAPIAPITTPPPLALPSIAFGAKAWQTHFGDVGVEPPLPSDIHQILSAPCPFFPNKKVGETHLLTLIPQTVNGKPLTLNLLQTLIEAPKQGHATKYRSYSSYVKNELGEGVIGPSHWVLMTKDVIEGSRNKSYTAQKALVEQHATRTGVPYELPKGLEAAAAILIEHVRSGTRLYTDEPWTFTRCQESVNKNQWPVAIGGFSPAGLCVYYFNYVIDDFGVGGLRKFPA